MAFTTRASRLFVKKETTEGVLIEPAAGTDAVALQEGFETLLEKELIDSPEIRGSIGAAKAIVGVDNASATIDHFLKHSGVEGVEPEDDLFLESLFGSKSVRTTERDTVAGSTAGTSTVRAALNVDAGEGVEFSRGDMLLIKDGTNGYSIRPVYSVSTDALSLGFNLTAAPASGVNLGKGVTYKPTNSGHPSMSMWDYRGNGAAIQALIGMQTVSASITANAGEILNTSYEFAGLGGYFDPIVVATTKYADFIDDDGTFAAAIPAGVYRPVELATLLGANMTATATTETHTVTYNNDTGKFKFTSTGTVLSLLWNTGANTANTIGTLIGFLVAADDTGVAASTGYTSDNAFSTLQSPYTPSYDTSSPLVMKANEIFLGKFHENFNVKDCVQSMEISIDVTKDPIPCATSASGRDVPIATARNVEITMTITLQQYEAQQFEYFADNESVSFFYVFGEKSGGNWVAAKSGAIYLPDAVIVGHKLSDTDGVVTVDLTVRAHVDASGNGEVYQGFV
jgi:hypothetical protein